MALDIKESFFKENAAIIQVKADKELVSYGDLQDINDDEEEVWIMQCPREIDIRQLEGQKMRLPGRTNIADVEAIALETTPCKQAFAYCNRKGRFALGLLPVCGKIILRNRINVNDVCSEDLETSFTAVHTMPVPVLRDRHPLLGADYESKTLDKTVKKRLQDASKTIKAGDHKRHKVKKRDKELQIK